jgi:hypothetical protein
LLSNIRPTNSSEVNHMAVGFRAPQDRVTESEASPDADTDLLAAALFITAKGVMVADQKVDKEEVVAWQRALERIALNSKSAMVRDAARVILSDFDRVATYVEDPRTPSFQDQMTAAGRVLARADVSDRHRFCVAAGFVATSIASATSPRFARSKISDQESEMIAVSMLTLGLDMSESLRWTNANGA